MDTADEQRRQMLVDSIGQGARVDLSALGAFVPAEWADRAAIGLDGVLRILPEPAADRLPPEVVELLEPMLEPLADALARQRLGAPEAVDALEAAHRLSAAVEAAVLHASQELAARTGEEQLRLKDVTDPGELSRTARERWRRGCKTLTATETSTLTGMGRGTARERVAIALAPQVSRSAVDQALVAGIARMDLVATWWRRCSRMPHESAGVVARALFATDADPAETAVERLTPEGELSRRPWAKKEFHQALEREALRQEAQDPQSQERDRQARHRRRDAYAEVDDDGTARMVITGDSISITGCAGRLGDLAARARRQGDPRTEPELRSDIARSLLLHGVLPLPDLGDEPSLITPQDIERLVDVLSGTPAHEVQVVVPWDVLTGTAALIGAGAVNPAPVDAFGSTRAAAGIPGAGAADTTEADTTEADTTAGISAGGAAPGDGAATDDGAAASGQPPGGVCTTRDAGAAPPGPPGAVGQVLGRYGRYLSAAEVRRIAGRPGTTFYRLLTDPADGRCLERTVTAYAPDAAMRAQLRAADVTSRAPGSTTPADSCQLDHVVEYLIGGTTTERNLQTLDVPFHAIKTEKFWDAEMDASRNVTWTSFWGRIYRTRPYDYRQFFTWVLGPDGDEPDSGDGTPGGDDTHADHLVDERYLASLLVYAALAQRGTGGRLESDDDDPDLDLDPQSLAAVQRLRDAVMLRHTSSSGRKVPGPRPGTPTPQELVATDRQQLLDHGDWVETVADATARRASGAPQEGTAADRDDAAEEQGPADDSPPPF